MAMCCPTKAASQQICQPLEGRVQDQCLNYLSSTSNGSSYTQWSALASMVWHSRLCISRDWQQVLSMHLPLHQRFYWHPKVFQMDNQGLGGSQMEEVQTRTICWWWKDNNGTVHDQTIPISYYVLQGGGVGLLPPQHWMQVMKKKKKKQRHVSQYVTYHDHVVLVWKEKYQLTVPMNKSNVGRFTLAPGYSRF